MDQQPGLTLELQKEVWNKLSHGWKKWDNLLMDFLKPMGNEIIRLLHHKKNDTVLDVATGMGEPGLTIASVLSGGKVIITDISENMLKIARQNAIQREINNIETIACDVCELPLADNSVDAISCRFGLMFFPDMLLAVKEMVRVLKPGGKIAVSVWNTPEKNFWLTATIATINKNMGLAPPEPGTPGMFRCAGNSFISGLFLKACLKNILVKEVAGKLNFNTTGAYWGLMTETVVPVIEALSKADAAMRRKIKREVHQTISRRYSNGNITLNANALVIYGEK